MVSWISLYDMFLMKDTINNIAFEHQYNDIALTQFL